MKVFNNMYGAIAVSICLTGAPAHADEPAQTTSSVPQPHQPPIPHHAPPPIPAPEPTEATPSINGLAAASALNAKSESVSPQATTLSPPVTLTYSGSSNALTVTDSGTGRGISSSVTNTGSGSSALYGSTVGSGAGLTGFNGGTGGPGGKFEVTNAKSAQAGAFASTNGTGPAILGTVTNSNDTSPAIYGQNTGGGIGVEGDGMLDGVYGSSTNGTGVFGYSAGTGGPGVYGSNSSDTGSGVSGFASGFYGTGVTGESKSGIGVLAMLDNGTPSVGNSALVADDYSSPNAGSYSVYAFSVSNTSGYFIGGSAGSGYCSFSGGTGWNCSSDKNLKKDFVPVDSTALLEHLAALPLFEYSMKGERTATRYVGPTAQDFMSAFHLGDDDTLINTANAQGVALAAAKGLYEKAKQDEDTIRQSAIEIATLKQELAAQTQRVAEMEQKFSARLAMIEQMQSAGVQTAALRVRQ